MNDAIAKRIGQVVAMFDNYTWCSLERFPPLYVVQRTDDKTTLQLSEFVLWDLMKTHVDKLKDSQLYRIMEAIENEDTAKQFAKKLLEDQQPMPAESAEILRDNFWDLI
jgi:hypothetical protein